ncbi:MAG: Hsp20/alpha crystallin family protein [Spirochaetales bacterium]|nr:Hsp20/alpha crystallin family protein [Spirochaetales bacterium]
MRSLIHYNPNRQMGLVDDFDRIFDGFFSNPGFWKNNAPLVDITEHEDAYVLEADLPGLTENDVDVKIENDILTISSEVKTDEEKKEKGYLVRERASRSFTRSFVLPKDVDREKIGAEFKKGVLVLSLPKAEAAKPRSIEIKSK